MKLNHKLAAATAIASIALVATMLSPTAQAESLDKGKFCVTAVNSTDPKFTSLKGFPACGESSSNPGDGSGKPDTCDVDTATFDEKYAAMQIEVFDKLGKKLTFGSYELKAKLLENFNAANLVDAKSLDGPSSLRRDWSDYSFDCESSMTENLRQAAAESAFEYQLVQNFTELHGVNKVTITHTIPFSGEGLDLEASELNVSSVNPRWEKLAEQNNEVIKDYVSAVVKDAFAIV